ncbi:MAG: P-II family nitrogen regulator [Oscillospiraceae bacterium]|jgi:nitrogen regulatory protein PII|nr:P-II family nitrogen regulator [Oscillospiraceae bacterium]
MKQFVLLCAVVPGGDGSKVLKIARAHGVHGGTVFMGRGTVPKSRLLEFFELTQIRREIVFMLTEHSSAREAMRYIGREFSLHRKNSGICFYSPVNQISGIENLKNITLKVTEGTEQTMYNIIYTVVEKGMAEEVMAAARGAGARGGTIINARGHGIHNNETLFLMPVEPEREIIMILAEAGVTQPIARAVREKLELDVPGKGILFIQGVCDVYGMALPADEETKEKN